MKSQAVFLHSPQQKYFKAGSVRRYFVCQCCGGWIWPYVRAHCENSLDLLGLGLSARQCLLFQLSAQPCETWCHPMLPATQQLAVPKHTQGNKHTVPPTHKHGVTTNTLLCKHSTRPRSNQLFHHPDIVWCNYKHLFEMMKSPQSSAVVLTPCVSILLIEVEGKPVHTEESTTILNQYGDHKCNMYII